MRLGAREFPGTGDPAYLLPPRSSDATPSGTRCASAG